MSLGPEPGAILPNSGLAWGIQLPIQAQSSRFAEAWEADAGPEDLARVARAADAAGCFYVAVCEHLAIPRSHAEAMGTTWYHTLTTLGWLAAHTERTRLLSHVVMPHFRHPLEAAKAFATLDRLSGGRAIAGVGTGHVVPELELLGVAPRERGALLDEAIGVLRAAFADEYPRAAGPRWPLDGELGVAPRPVQHALPIWVGGSSKPAIRRAAWLGDGWLPQGTPLDDLPGAIALLRDERDAAGRDPRIDIGRTSRSTTAPRAGTSVRCSAARATRWPNRSGAGARSASGSCRSTSARATPTSCAISSPASAPRRRPCSPRPARSTRARRSAPRCPTARRAAPRRSGRSR